MSKWTARNNYVIAELITTPQQSLDGIILPDINTLRERWAIVKSVGPGSPDFNGELIEPDVKEGETVYVASHGQHAMKAFINDEWSELMVASSLDCLAILEDNMNIKPLGSYIEIEKIDNPNDMDGIQLPSSLRLPPNIGKVITLGKGFTTPNGSRLGFQVEVGDIVAYEPFREMVVDMRLLGKDEKKIIVTHGNIVAVMEQ